MVQRFLVPGSTRNPAFFLSARTLNFARIAAVILSATLLSLTGCAAPRYMESFFIDAGVQQYFFRAANFKNNKTKASVDFTYRNNVSDSGFCACNFSLVHPSIRPHKTIAASFVFNGADTARLIEPSLLFFEGQDNMVRYSSRMKVADFRRLLDAKQVEMVVSFGNGIRKLFPPDDFSKRQQRARTDIIFP